MRVVGILLAAGEATRFGGDKLMTQLAGERIGVMACRHLVAALPEVVAVVRPNDAALATMLHAAGARVIRCVNADDGMGASLACGVAATMDAHGWIVALADMPWIRTATTRQIVDAIE